MADPKESKHGVDQEAAKQRFLQTVTEFLTLYGKCLPKTYFEVLTACETRGFSRGLQRRANEYTQNGAADLIVAMMKAFFVGFDTLHRSFGSRQTKRRLIHYHWIHFHRGPQWYIPNEYPVFSKLVSLADLKEVVQAAYLKASDPDDRYRAFNRKSATLFETESE
jgi:hypothetical protein